MILLNNIVRTYPTPRGKMTPLCGVTLHIPPGHFVMVLGSSGAGKTTLLSIIGGLLKPTQGHVTVQGQSLWAMDPGSRARFRALTTGLMLQGAPAIGSLTVLENVLLPEMFLPSHRRQGAAYAWELLDQVGLTHKARSYPAQLSGGEQRRVAIASALMCDPPLLLADEPTGDLDSKTERHILDLFVRLHRRGRTIVMVTHNEELTTLADRVLRIEQGRVLEQGDSCAAVDGTVTPATDLPQEVRT